MNWKPVEKKSIPHLTYRKGKVQTMLSEFMEAGIESAELTLEEGEYASLASAQSTINRSFKSMHKDSLYGAIIRNEKLYLVKKL